VSPELFTGHCWRRTAATIFADAGATSAELKRKFHWQNEVTALEYVDASKVTKMKDAGMLSGKLFSAASLAPIPQKGQEKKKKCECSVGGLLIHHATTVQIFMGSATKPEPELEPEPEPEPIMALYTTGSRPIARA